MYIYLIIKYFCLFLTSIYIFAKLSNAKINYLEIKATLCAIFLALIISTYRLGNSFLSVTFSYISFFISTFLVFHTELELCFFISLISFCFSHTTLIISNYISVVILYPLFRNMSYPPDIIAILCSALFTWLFSYLLFRSQKIQKGIKYIWTPVFINSISIIGFLLIISLTVTQIYSGANNSIKLIGLYISIIVLIFLFIWQHQIKRYYTAKLRKLELESLRQELEEKEAMIQKLTDSNEELARIIHRDNKLIPAALNAVTEYLQSAENSTIPEQKKHGEALCAQLQELANDRMGILTASARADQTISLTGYAAVDAMLSYMQKRADSERITYEVKLHPDFASKIGKEISEADLSHLLSDLIENAIIATRKTEHKHVCVHLGILYDAPAVEVSDSGIPFAPEVYQDFGLQKHSTHLDEGGSGIGLMDIWELKKKYAASLHIYEYMPETTLFTKKISLVFDHRKHYLIRSCRPEEIIKLQARSDLYILPLQDKTP